MGQPKKRQKVSAEAPAQTSKKDLWDLYWVREPQQTRSARTRAQLLDATQAILNKSGPEDVTVGEIAKIAGCSVGTLYHYFQDRQTIIYAVLDRFTDEVAHTAEKGLEPSLWEGVPLIDVLDGYLRFWLKLLRKNPGVMRATTLMSMHDKNIDTRFQASRKKARATIMRLIRPRFDEIDHPDPQIAVTYVLEAFRVMLFQRSLSFLPGARRPVPNQSDEAFIAEMKRMAARYLGLQAE